MLIAFLAVCLLPPATFFTTLVGGLVAGYFRYHSASAPRESIHFVHCGGSDSDPACASRPTIVP